jgi:hypothetical protein
MVGHDQLWDLSYSQVLQLANQELESQTTKKMMVKTQTTIKVIQLAEAR